MKWLAPALAGIIVGLIGRAMFDAPLWAMYYVSMILYAIWWKRG